MKNTSTTYILMAIAAIKTGDPVKVAEVEKEIVAQRNAEINEAWESVYMTFGFCKDDREMLVNTMLKIDNCDYPLHCPDLRAAAHLNAEIARIESKYNPAIFLLSDWENDNGDISDDTDDADTAEWKKLIGDTKNYDWSPVG